MNWPRRGLCCEIEVQSAGSNGEWRTDLQPEFGQVGGAGAEHELGQRHVERGAQEGRVNWSAQAGAHGAGRRVGARPDVRNAAAGQGNTARPQIPCRRAGPTLRRGWPATSSVHHGGLVEPGTGGNRGTWPAGVHGNPRLKAWQSVSPLGWLWWRYCRPS